MLESLEYSFQEGDIVREDFRILGKSSCSHFQEALKLFGEKKIGYYYLYLDKMEEQLRDTLVQEMRSRFTPDLLCPFLILENGEYLSGFDRKIWEKKLSL